MQESEVIYDWNVQGHATSPPMRRVQVHDETLRDGIQGPSIADPPIEVKVRALRLMDALGVDSVNVGLPGAGPRARADAETLVRVIASEKLSITPACAARTHPNDIAPIVELSQRTGVAIEPMMFLGASPIRMLVEDWNEDRLESLTRQAMQLAKSGGLSATFVTEDTTRSNPTTLMRLFRAAVSEGADRLVLCDTVGHSTPNGVFNLIHWADNLLVGLGVRDRVKLDWHGHNDRGFALINALYAIQAGVDRVHGCVLGIGERVGNTSLDHLLVNLKLMGVEPRDLSPLAQLVDLIATGCDWPIPPSYPVFGRDAFRTGTGVHAAAVVKATQQGQDWLSDSVYSGVPARWFGREQEIEIGHQSGLSNVRYWLAHRGITATEPLVQAIFKRAKQGNTLLSEAQVLAIVARHQG